MVLSKNLHGSGHKNNLSSKKFQCQFFRIYLGIVLGCLQGSKRSKWQVSLCIGLAFWMIQTILWWNLYAHIRRDGCQVRISTEVNVCIDLSARAGVIFCAWRFSSGLAYGQDHKIFLTRYLHNGEITKGRGKISQKPKVRSPDLGSENVAILHDIISHYTDYETEFFIAVLAY